MAHSSTDSTLSRRHFFSAGQLPYFESAAAEFSVITMLLGNGMFLLPDRMCSLSLGIVALSKKQKVHNRTLQMTRQMCITQVPRSGAANYLPRSYSNTLESFPGC